MEELEEAERDEANRTWALEQFCPDNLCGHLVRLHDPVHVSGKLKMFCKECACKSGWNYIIGTLMAFRREAGLPETPDDEKIEAKPLVLPDDLFDPVVGYDDVKWLLKRSLASERATHFLFVGPPASAKSLILMELERLEGAYYAVGSGASKAGLRQLLLDLDPTILLVDELDKVRTVKDYAVLLSLMESGVVAETLYKRHRKATRSTRVFAAANEDEDLTPELLSRFVRLRFHPYTVADFLVIADRVLVDREGVEPDLAHAIANAVWNDLRSRDIRDAVKIARLIQAPDELTQIVNVLRTYR